MPLERSVPTKGSFAAFISRLVTSRQLVLRHRVWRDMETQFSYRSVARAGSLRRGFTILEILVVIAIIGLLVGLVVNHLTRISDLAEMQIASIFVNSSIKTPLMSFKLQLHRFPTTEEGLAALVVPPSGLQSQWQGPYLEPAEPPVDPWGEPYQYVCPGHHNPVGYDVWSKGPDRQSGTADDVGNWKRTTAVP